MIWFEGFIIAYLKKNLKISIYIIVFETFG